MKPERPSVSEGVSDVEGNFSSGNIGSMSIKKYKIGASSGGGDLGSGSVLIFRIGVIVRECGPVCVIALRGAGPSHSDPSIAIQFGFPHMTGTGGKGKAGSVDDHLAAFAFLTKHVVEPHAVGIGACVNVYFPCRTEKRMFVQTIFSPDSPDKGNAAVADVGIEGLTPEIYTSTAPGAGSGKIRVEKVFVVLHVEGVGFADLSEIAEALGLLCSGFGLLQSGQKHGRKYGYYRNDDQ